MIGIFLLPAIALANMNGEYAIANPNLAAATKWSSEYTAKYIDVYSPVVQTEYAEVFWKMMGPVPLPAEFVKRYAGKVCAITGYEVNHIFNTSSGEVFVPLYWQYNHHFEAYLNGAHSFLAKRPESSMHLSSGHYNTYTIVQSESDPTPNSPIPSSAWFSEGNGGEMRKSYHGYPKGYAQLIDSPVSFSVQPMQIDTHNREYTGPGYKAGPQPRSSSAPPDAKWSGLLECPCTTRNFKHIVVNYTTLNANTCPRAVFTANDCYDAARRVLSSSGVVSNKTVSDPSMPVGCSVTPSGSGTKGEYTAVFNTLTNAAPCHSKSGGHLMASHSNLVDFSLELDAQQATITITGPSSVWFGVAFNAYQMGDLPYAIVVNGSGMVSEHKLAEHAPGAELAPSITVVSNTLSGSRRTVVLTRALKGMSPSYYTFGALNFPMLEAVGDTPNFAYHKSKATFDISLVDTAAPTCICESGAKGTINNMTFSKNCAAEPTGDLLQQHNPTCDIRTYVGGTSCCHHGWKLLDADQPDPWPGQKDSIHLKFRFYYDDYTPETYQNLIRLYWTTEAGAGEYDVVKADPGTPPENTVFTITSRFQVQEMLHNCSTRGDGGCTGILYPNTTFTGIKILYAGGHCHAPACMSLDLYNADTGKLICHQEPVFGTGTEPMNEEGYLAIPPCLWGSVEEGLMEPQFLSFKTNLLSIKSNNNTYYHYGEMASWQMRGVLV